MNKHVFVEQKKEEYKDDEELSKFLMSYKSDEYKYSIISLLETDYSRFTYGGPRVTLKYQADLRELNKDVIKQYKAAYRKSNKEAIKRQRVDYYESNKDAIKQHRVAYYESNKEAIKRRQANYRELNRQNKVHYCKLCDKAFGQNIELQGHLKSLKHLNREREKVILEDNRNDD